MVWGFVPGVRDSWNTYILHHVFLPLMNTIANCRARSVGDTLPILPGLHGRSLFQIRLNGPGIWMPFVRHWKLSQMDQFNV